jgi:AcrR family transcriptional regulator
MTPTVPTRPTSGRQARGDRTRARIIELTVSSVLDHGLDGVNVSSIAEAAGVTWGVVQYHFGDREGLLAAVVAQGFEELTDVLRPLGDVAAVGDVRARVSAVVAAAWPAMSGPTSRAAIEVLISTRATRSGAGRRQISRLSQVFASLGEAVGSTLSPDQAAAVGAFLLTNLRGLVTAQLIVSPRLEVTAELDLLVDVVTTYIEGVQQG